MRQPPAPLALLLAAAVAVGLGLAWIPGGWPAEPFHDVTPGVSLFPAGYWGPLALAWCALSGRVLLAWLPPGPVGGHGPAELPLTWAASHLLGFVAAVPLGLLGLTPLHPAVVVGWGLLAAVRIVTLPAAMVPRHAPARERASGAVRAGAILATVLVLGLAAGLVQRQDPAQAPLLAAAHYLAAVVILAHALALVRLAPAGRLAVWTAFALTPALLVTGLLGVLGCAAGAGFAGGWWRRACRRSLWLSLAGWTAVLLAGDPDIAALGVLVLVACTSTTARRGPFLVAAALAWVAVHATALVSGAASQDLGVLRAVARLELFGLAWVGLAAALVCGWILPFPPRERVARIDPPHATASACLVLLVGTLVPRTLIWCQIDPAWTLTLLLPALALLCGAVFVRTERPG